MLISISLSSMDYVKANAYYPKSEVVSMWNCPVCKIKNQGIVCQCGFDVSLDCTHYPTLMSIPAGADAISAMRRKKQLNNQQLYHCPECGANRFRIVNTDFSILCDACMQPLRLRAHLPESEEGSVPPKPQYQKSSPIKATLPTPSAVLPLTPGFQHLPPHCLIAAGDGYSVGLQADGTVVACSIQGIERAETKWKDLIAISAGYSHTVGLRKDGTVIAAGENLDDRCQVSNWKNITAIAAGVTNTIGLHKDGTVVVANSNSARYAAVRTWKDIVTVSAGYDHVVGLNDTGSVVIDGNDWGQHQIWNNITAIAAGNRYTVGLQKDGRVVATGDTAYGKCNVSSWSDIIAIAAGYNHTVGLRKDGTVVATGINTSGQCDVQRWTHIVAIAAGVHHTLGLQEDGTIVTTSKSHTKIISNWKILATDTAEQPTPAEVRNPQRTLSTLFRKT